MARLWVGWRPQGLPTTIGPNRRWAKVDTMEGDEGGGWRIRFLPFWSAVCVETFMVNSCISFTSFLLPSCWWFFPYLLVVFSVSVPYKVCCNGPCKGLPVTLVRITQSSTCCARIL